MKLATSKKHHAYIFPFPVPLPPQMSYTSPQGLVLVRLVRLLRLLRMINSMPALRSIVGALFEGVISSGWVVMLVSVFNYIMSCRYPYVRVHACVSGANGWLWAVGGLRAARGEFSKLCQVSQPCAFSLTHLYNEHTCLGTYSGVLLFRKINPFHFGTIPRAFMATG